MREGASERGSEGASEGARGVRICTAITITCTAITSIAHHHSWGSWRYLGLPFTHTGPTFTMKRGLRTHSPRRAHLKSRRTNVVVSACFYIDPPSHGEARLGMVLQDIVTCHHVSSNCNKVRVTKHGILMHYATSNYMISQHSTVQ